jgi:hypothetical protein
MVSDPIFIGMNPTQLWNAFRRKCGAPLQDLAYSQSLSRAIQFTAEQNFELDSDRNAIGAPYDMKLIHNLVQEIADMFEGHFETYKSAAVDPIVQFGGECGNIHCDVLDFMHRYYPDLLANLTIGEVRFSRDAMFAFSEEKYLQWLQARPKQLDCHVWITVGHSAIIDATIGTYINDRRLKSKILGGVFCGNPKQLSWYPVLLGENRCPDVSTLDYLPVILGRKALFAAGPIDESMRPLKV